VWEVGPGQVSRTCSSSWPGNQAGGARLAQATCSYGSAFTRPAWSCKLLRSSCMQAVVCPVTGVCAVLIGGSEMKRHQLCATAHHMGLL
jgi:hypothetical protein